MGFDQKKHLKQLHQNRRIQTIHKIEQALSYLQSAKQPINFSRVAKQAKVSKSTLYSIPEIKEKVVLYRKKSLQQSYNSPRDMKSDSVIRSLKRKIVTLENENKELQLQVKKLYGVLYENTIQK